MCRTSQRRFVFLFTLAVDPGGWRRPVSDSPAGLTAAWYARSVLRAVCVAACLWSAQAAHLWPPLLNPVCFDTSDAVSFNNTSFIPAINPVHPSPTTSPSLPPSARFYIFLLAISDSGGYTKYLFFLSFYSLLGFGEKKHCSTSFFESRFSFSQLSMLQSNCLKL